MKTWTVLAGLSAAASMASATTTLVEFNQKLLALSHGRGKRQGITFNTLQDEEGPLPSADELSIRDGYYGGSDRIACSLTETRTNSGTATVVLAISKCLNQSSIDMIEAWIAKVQQEQLRYNDNGEEKTLQFDTTLIPGACQERTELEKAGRYTRKPWTYSHGYKDKDTGGEVPDSENENKDGDENGGENGDEIDNANGNGNEKGNENDNENGNDNGNDNENDNENGNDKGNDNGDDHGDDKGNDNGDNHGDDKGDNHGDDKGDDHGDDKGNDNGDDHGGDKGNDNGDENQDSKLLLTDGFEHNGVERIQAFAKYGRVLESLDDANFDDSVAVMSFVGDESSFDYVTSYETKYNISQTFNFQICKDGESCDGHFENCIQLEETVDLFLYNPFQIARSLQCNNLDGGIPVIFLNSTGDRDCFCTCPAGTEMEEVGYGFHRCVDVDSKVCPCVWNKHKFGYKHDNVEKLDACSFSGIATNWSVDVPFPSDNYVADLRVNAHDVDNAPDGPDEGPRIDVVVTPLYSNEYAYETLVSLYQAVYPGEPMPELSPYEADMLSTYGLGELGAVSYPTSYQGDSYRKHLTWSDYQKNRKEKIDEITFKAYGKYQLSIEAFDYEKESAECVGCVAVVDQYRPKATTTCPKGFCDNTTSICKSVGSAVAELTEENLDKAKCLLDDFYDYKHKAENDACNSERCDEDEFLYRNFFESEYTPCSYGSTCFEKEVIVKDFKESPTATKNPLENDDGTACQSRHPVPPHQCVRCCQYSTKLREFWVDYTCGSDYDVRQCSGDEDQSCSFEQCLLLTGDMVVEAKASIKEEVTEKSKNVLKGLRDQGYQTYTQIHHAVPCADFNPDDEKCVYLAKVEDLIDVSATNLFDDSDNTYAFWRYRIGGDESAWKLWGQDDEPYTFTTTETKITVEAWTACGAARKFFFYVHLHPHTDIKVCEVFKQMWYQTSQARAAVPETLCTYPGSDFAELTFDYQANIGLKHARTSVHMHIQQVTCNLTYLSSPGRTPVQILDSSANSSDIVERFAIEMLNLDTTLSSTAVKLDCTFSYADEDGDEPVSHPCSLDFSITDCNGPVIDVPHGECSWDGCAGNNKPGPFEACGGKVVRATQTAAYLDTEETECCDDCQELPLECVPILDLPDSTQDIKRCVPKKSYGGAYGNDGTDNYEDNYGTGEYDTGEYGTGEYGTNDYSAEEPSVEFTPSVFLAKAVAAHPTAVAAMALVAASGLVALVAVVVVHRRRARAAETVIIEDAYYPLLH